MELSDNILRLSKMLVDHNKYILQLLSKMLLQIKKWHIIIFISLGKWIQIDQSPFVLVIIKKIHTLKIQEEECNANETRYDFELNQLK
jgi:hypothetical protein